MDENEVEMREEDSQNGNDEDMLPGEQDVEAEDDYENEDKECDFSAYVLFHQGRLDAPCLSFDVIEDNLGSKRSCDEPVSCTLLCGSQAAKESKNKITLVKVNDMKKIKDDEDDDEDYDDNTTRMVSVKHKGCVNRIRCTKNDGASLAATWSALGFVNVWNLQPMLEALEDENNKKVMLDLEPATSFQLPSKKEGYGIGLSHIEAGLFAVGDCSGGLYVCRSIEGGQWQVGDRLEGHTGSVEDVQWSPAESHMLATASVDRTVRIWDTRAKSSKACKLTTQASSTSDVNVLSWNSQDTSLIATGDDAGLLRVWDLRAIEVPVAELRYHKEAVTSVEWMPSDASVLASSGADNCVLQWDMAAERVEAKENKNKKEEGEEDDEGEDMDIPAQLLFVHEGQRDPKELHWHPQVPGLLLTTGENGFNIFKTISC